MAFGQKKLVIEGKSGIPQVFHMKDSIDLGYESYSSYNTLIPHIPKCAIEKLGSRFTECRLCFFYKPLLYALWSVCFTGRFMKVDQRYVWCHWGELFFAWKVVSALEMLHQALPEQVIESRMCTGTFKVGKRCLLRTAVFFVTRLC